MSTENKPYNIQEAKEEFKNNSLNLTFKPYVLRRFDTYNYVISTFKINKKTEEEYESKLGYYGSIHSALVGLFKKMFNQYPRKEAFIKYYFYKATYGTKDLEQEVQECFLNEVKLAKSKDYVFHNTYIKNTEAIYLGAIKLD